jgi:primosomal protein N' (replication factor Y)
MECPTCGSKRLSSAGLTVERVRGILANVLDVEVGLFTASEREGVEAPVVVGTARCVLEEEWELGVIPDADSLLFSEAGSTEKGFRFLYKAAEASKDQLVVQTRSPEHPTLQAALRGDYEAFSAAELPKRRALGYPPYAHLAEITFEGTEKEVRRAVELCLRPALGSGVELLDPVPIAAPPSPENGRLPAWRALLRSRKRAALTEATALVARLSARRSGGLKTRINMDPEEV